MKRYKLHLLIAFAITGFASASYAVETKVEPTAPKVEEPLAPKPVDANTTRNIVDALASRHYVSIPLDDHQSEKIFSAYLEDLDPSRSYFLASDIAKFDKYRTTLDDSLSRGDVSPAFDIFNVYQRRVEDRFENVIATLKKGVDKFDFTRNETLLLDRKNAPWATDEAALNDLWRKRVKEEILNLELAGKAPEKIQELLIKRYENRLDRTRQTNSDDVYQVYMNSFTRTYDPHTQYFSPRTSENFNINRSTCNSDGWRSSKFVTAMSSKPGL